MPQLFSHLLFTVWLVQEKLALVEFLLFYGLSTWTATKNDVFWRKCAEFVEVRAKASVKRTGQVGSSMGV